MSRINTNVNSLIAQRVLRNNNNSVNSSLERLSTGLRINRGADNPAGLIASENLRAEKTGIQAALDNASRATNIVGTAEGGLNEVSSLLNELQGLVGSTANAAGLSAEEVSANQLQVDSILSTVNRLAQATSFQGKKLLDGSLDYTTANVSTTNIDAFKINSAKLVDGVDTQVLVEVVTSAQVAAVNITSGAANSPFTIEVAGKLGTQQLSFGSGTSITSVRDAINAVTAATGVSAVVSGSNLRINSTEFGSSQFVTVKAIQGDFESLTQGSTGTQNGTDAVVRVNGAAAEVDGLKVSYRSSNLDVEIDLAQAFNTNAASTTFDITGGGANFSLGSKVTEADKVSLGIGSVSTGSLGNNSVGFLSSLQSGGSNSLTSGNLVNSQKIVDAAIRQVSQVRGRLGAFQKFVVGSTVNNLGVALENANAAESAIRDTDFAEETSKLTRNQILSQAATTVLAQANAVPQQALSLLQ